MLRGPMYPKPISAEQKLLIETLTMHYEGVEAPFMVFDHGDCVEIRHAPTIRRATPWKENVPPQAIPVGADGGLDANS